jgi:hypothetical protein
MCVLPFLVRSCVAWEWPNAKPNYWIGVATNLKKEIFLKIPIFL